MDARDGTDLFETLARALVHAGIYVSYADGEPERIGYAPKGDDLKAEADALNGVFSQLAAKGGFSARIAQPALRVLDAFPPPHSSAEAQQKQKEVENAPQEAKAACTAALVYLSPEEARLYTDMVMSVCATVAQAYDEGSVSSATDRFFDFVTILGSQSTDYLSNLTGLLSDTKISAREDAAINKIGAQMRAAWDASGKI